MAGIRLSPPRAFPIAALASQGPTVTFEHLQDGFDSRVFLAKIAYSCPPCCYVSCISSLDALLLFFSSLLFSALD
jgi:hypothetical protein